jgi:hypothetical protein
MFKAEGPFDPDQVLPREDGSLEHPHLRTYDGFDCDGCTFHTIRLQSMKRHFSDPTMRGQCRHRVRSRTNLTSYSSTSFYRRGLAAGGDNTGVSSVTAADCGRSNASRFRTILRFIRECERERERGRMTTVIWLVGPQTKNSSLTRHDISSGLGTPSNATATGSRPDERSLHGTVPHNWLRDPGAKFLMRYLSGSFFEACRQPALLHFTAILVFIVCCFALVLTPLFLKLCVRRVE